ncbi:MAG: carboxypeptidase-like regulatory domain-containing protein, partial [Terriglobia bacterium]
MTLSRRWVRGAVWVVLLMVGSVLARAQEVSGSISGTVMDATGASVSGAVVTLTNTDRAYVERSLKTDKIGYYTASSLPLGNYSVTIAMKGFKTVTVSGLVLHANDALKLDRKLAVGSASDTVSVVANRAALNLENGMSEGLVSGTQVRELPLVTRNYEQLLTLQPGVSYGSDTNDQLYMGGSSPLGMTDLALFSINGLRPTANNWTIDGADNVNRGGASSISGANMTPLAYPSVDAISEFVTLRGTYEAEYGRSASGQINVVTNSGTNAFHGGAYEYFRNDVFNADNYFNKLTTPITPTPPLRYNDFGFTVGGPVVIPHYYNGRDKTFFFYSQEFRRVVQYQSLTSYVPTAAERAGDFTNAYLTNSSGQYTGGTGPVAVCESPNTGACTAYITTFAGTSGFISATSQAYVNSIYNNVPLPSSAADIAAGLDPHTLISNLRNIFHETQELVRVDHALNSKTNIFYRYMNDSIPTVEGAGLFPGSNPMPEINGNELVGVSETFTKSPGIQQVGHVTIAARPSLLFDMGYAYSLGKI